MLFPPIETLYRELRSSVCRRHVCFADCWRSITGDGVDAPQDPVLIPSSPCCKTRLLNSVSFLKYQKRYVYMHRHKNGILHNLIKTGIVESLETHRCCVFGRSVTSDPLVLSGIRNLQTLVESDEFRRLSIPDVCLRCHCCSVDCALANLFFIYPLFWI